ncbi:MAG TPA: sigma-70 family RNA polymerase sigma factor [Chryseolinea sp.]|nr:sigma-70 family RNA polymerase sigma factor [Chryseolinea sp.]
MIPGANDRSLNQLLQAWPSKAIAYLYNQYYEILVHIAERRTQDRKASEDIVQEVFIELWKKSDAISRREGFLVIPYLVSMVKKKSFTVYRNGLKHADNAMPLLEQMPSPVPSTEYELMKTDRHWTLQLIVAALPARQKQCIEMRFLGEMSIESIAIRLSITQKAVEKNITQGLKRLRMYRSSVR